MVYLERNDGGDDSSFGNQITITFTSFQICVVGLVFHSSIR